VPGRFRVYSKNNFFYINCPIEEAPVDTWLQKQIISKFDFFTIIPDPLDEDFYGLEGQLAAELAAPLPDELAQPTLPEIDPDDFERLYQWFLA
jgi:hypothetical protein